MIFASAVKKLLTDVKEIHSKRLKASVHIDNYGIFVVECDDYPEPYAIDVDCFIVKDWKEKR